MVLAMVFIYTHRTFFALSYVDLCKEKLSSSVRVVPWPQSRAVPGGRASANAGIPKDSATVRPGPYPALAAD